MADEKTLFSWQEECLTCWEKAGNHGIISVVTGAGKTYFALSAAKSLLERNPSQHRVRIVVPTVSLAYQWYHAIRDMMGNETSIGFFFGEVRSAQSLPWMIYVINSARYALSRHVLQDMKEGTAVLLITDECHRYGSKENSKIFDFMKHSGFRPELYASIGLSATPECRHLEDVLIPALGPIIYSYSLDQAVREKVVSDFSVSQIRVSFNADEQLQYTRLTNAIMKLMKVLLKKYPELQELSRPALYNRIRGLAKKEGEKSPEQKLLNLTDKRRLLCSLAESRGSCVMHLIRELPPCGRILIFCEIIEQANLLAALLMEEGISRIGRYHSGMSAEARKTTLERYRDHEIRILICCTALDEGLDVPDTSFAIVVSCSSVMRQRIQRLGRILRRSEDKDLAGLYYLYLDRTMEDPVYLEDICRNHPVCSMKYLSQEKSFVCPVYLQLADDALSLYAKRGASAGQLKTMRENLVKGHVRNDWLMTPEKLLALAKGTKEQGEKNYRIAMSVMARLRIEAGRDLPAVCNETDREE